MVSVYLRREVFKRINLNLAGINGIKSFSLTTNYFLSRNKSKNRQKYRGNRQKIERTVLASETDEPVSLILVIGELIYFYS